MGNAVGEQEGIGDGTELGSAEDGTGVGSGDGAKEGKELGDAVDGI